MSQIDTVQRRFGWHPDPAKRIDEKPDFEAGPLLGASEPPPAASAARLVPTIFDQHTLGSCVANAGMQAVRASQIKQGLPAAVGSRLFGYYFSRVLHGAQLEDAGTYIRLFFQALNTFGFPREEYWPYDEAKVNSKPAKNAVRMAFDQILPTEYYRITSNGSERLRDIKRAIAAEHLVVFGTIVGRNFGSSQIKPTVPLAPPEDGTYIGGHAMCIDAYDGDSFEVVNSWGTGWGSKGKCLFSAEYLEWYQTNDLWVVKVAPDFSDPT